MAKSVTVRAPCSTANLGPGFDVFGMALDALYDNVILNLSQILTKVKIFLASSSPF